MIRRVRMLAIVAFAALLMALIWRIFWYESPTPPPVPAAPSVAPQPAMPRDESTLILDLFDPSEAVLAEQHSATLLSQQLEQAMTVTFVLKRCDMLSDSQYADTYRALVTYAYRAKLAASYTEADQFMRGISSSAAASYQLLYGRLSCQASELPGLARQLADWRELTLGT